MPRKEYLGELGNSESLPRSIPGGVEFIGNQQGSPYQEIFEWFLHDIKAVRDSVVVLNLEYLKGDRVSIGFLRRLMLHVNSFNQALRSGSMLLTDDKGGIELVRPKVEVIMPDNLRNKRKPSTGVSGKRLGETLLNCLLLDGIRALPNPDWDRIAAAYGICGPEDLEQRIIRNNLVTARQIGKVALALTGKDRKKTSPRQVVVGKADVRVSLAAGVTAGAQFMIGHKKNALAIGASALILAGCGQINAAESTPLPTVEEIIDQLPTDILSPDTEPTDKPEVEPTAEPSPTVPPDPEVPYRNPVDSEDGVVKYTEEWNSKTKEWVKVENPFQVIDGLKVEGNNKVYQYRNGKWHLVKLNVALKNAHNVEFGIEENADDSYSLVVRDTRTHISKSIWIDGHWRTLNENNPDDFELIYGRLVPPINKMHYWNSTILTDMETQQSFVEMRVVYLGEHFVEEVEGFKIDFFKGAMRDNTNKIHLVNIGVTTDAEPGHAIKFASTCTENGKHGEMWTHYGMGVEDILGEIGSGDVFTLSLPVITERSPKLVIPPIRSQILPDYPGKKAVYTNLDQVIFSRLAGYNSLPPESIIEVINGNNPWPDSLVYAFYSIGQLRAEKLPEHELPCDVY